MKTSNLASETLRHSESGLVYEEVLSGAQGTINLKPYQTFRVRAAGATTVTIDGVLAMTMSTGEICILNAGPGVPADIDPSPGGVVVRQAVSVVVTIAGANAFVQVARDAGRRL